jgi:uncharacterized protein YkwD
MTAILMVPQSFLFILWAFQSLAIVGPPSPEALRQELLARFNEERAAAGAAPLRIAEPLNQVAQENAQEIHERGGMVYDEKAIPAIQRRLRKSGYEAHGWHQAFAAGPDDPAALVAWVKKEYPDTFRSLMDPDYQEVGIGLSDLQGRTPLYTFFLAWRESESFARQTAALSDPARVRSEVLDRTNAERAAAGLPPLVLDARLNDAAQRHAEDMLLRSYYSHSSPEGRAPGDRVRKSGYSPIRVGENIARGALSVDEVMDNWMASREHRNNILHPGFADLGVGVAVGRNSVGYTVLWVQDFGR